MAGDTLVIVEDLDRPAGEPHIDTATDQPVRYRVEGLIDFDVIIGMDLCGFPFGVFERHIRQRRQCRPFDLLEQTPAGLAELTHRPVVQVLQQNADGGIQIGETEESPMAKPRQYPALDDQHRAFDLGLVARLAAARRQNRRVVVLRHGGKGLIERRLKPQRLGHARLQVIADDRFGNAAEVRKSPALAFNPIRQPLAEAGHRIGQRRRPQDRDKNLRRTYLARLRVDHLGRLPGVIGLHHRTRLVAMAEGRMRPALIGTERLAKPGVAVTIGMRRTIFLPKQRQRHPLALELLRHQRPVRLAQVQGWTSDPAKQRPLQSPIAVIER
jgi:hypothetical protein